MCIMIFSHFGSSPEKESSADECNSVNNINNSSWTQRQDQCALLVWQIILEQWWIFEKRCRLKFSVNGFFSSWNRTNQIELELNLCFIFYSIHKVLSFSIEKSSQLLWLNKSMLSSSLDKTATSLSVSNMDATDGCHLITLIFDTAHPYHEECTCVYYLALSTSSTYLFRWMHRTCNWIQFTILPRMVFQSKNRISKKAKIFKRLHNK